MIVVEKVEYYEIDQLRKRERYYQDKENPRFGDRAHITEEERSKLMCYDKSGKRRQPLIGYTPGKGYKLDKRTGRFRSSISLKGFFDDLLRGKPHHLGMFDVKEEAQEAYMRAFHARGVIYDILKKIEL